MTTKEKNSRLWKAVTRNLGRKLSKVLFFNEVIRLGKEKNIPEYALRRALDENKAVRARLNINSPEDYMKRIYNPGEVNGLLVVSRRYA